MFKRLSSTQDLNKHERNGLREHGIKPEAFDRMDAQSQHEWKEELKDDRYWQDRKKIGYKNLSMVGFYKFNKINPEMQAIWDEKEELLSKLEDRHKFEFCTPTELRREIFERRWYYPLVQLVYIPIIKFKKLITKKICQQSI